MKQLVASASQLDNYTGPDFGVIDSVDEDRFEVRSFKTKERIGGTRYPLHIAERIRDEYDAKARKQYLKDLKVKKLKAEVKVSSVELATPALSRHRAFPLIRSWLQGLSSMKLRRVADDPETIIDMMVKSDDSTLQSIKPLLTNPDRQIINQVRMAVHHTLDDFRDTGR